MSLSRRVGLGAVIGFALGTAFANLTLSDPDVLQRSDIIYFILLLGLPLAFLGGIIGALSGTNR